MYLVIYVFSMQVLLFGGYILIARYMYRDSVLGKWITRERDWLGGTLTVCNAALLGIMYILGLK